MPQTPEDLDAFYTWAQEADRRGPIAIDTETTGLRLYAAGFSLRTVQFGDAHTAWVIHWERGGEFQHYARAVLTRVRRVIIHHVMYDWPVLDRHAGIRIEHLAPRTRDTLIMATLIDPRRAKAGGIGGKLKALSARWIDPAAPDTETGLHEVFRELGLTAETGWANIPLDHPVYNLYAGLDTILASRLEPKLAAELNRLGVPQSLGDYEHQIARMCAIMARAGLILDIDYTRRLDGKLADQVVEFTKTAARYGVANVNSGAQVADALLGMGERLAERTPSGAYRLDKAVLLPLADLDEDWERLSVRTPNPLAHAVLRARRASTWRTSFVSAFLDHVGADGRIHPVIKPMEAITGRMGLEKPPLHGVPAGDSEVRGCFLGEPGHVMVSADFSAVEMRVLAAIADVSGMKAAVAAGRDLHDHTAELVFGPGFTPRQRTLAKKIGLGKIYGGGKETIARQSGAPIEDVARALAAFNRQFPEVAWAARNWQASAFRNGMWLTTSIGRRIPLGRDRAYAATNYMCQSTAREVLGQAMLNIESAGLLQYARLPIHDEVLSSVPAGQAPEIAREIERAMSFDLYGVPITAKAKVGGRSWGSLYESGV
ncbi:DNA polymerase [Kitasatospora purpeofusca]|uniref:DNA polymerase n=1 Tax=Kitasatospora purpeofusca TaxID=67352 RepID=UPI002E122048|nr:DNA polymerase [Kitasatospora purpeofusca]WSR40354.1 DNA polymerase [Kitasatospora purpeofusca]